VRRSILLFLLPFIVFTYVVFLLSQSACGYVRATKAVKEIPFNHKSHMTKDYGIDNCESCHKYTADGRFQGMPTVAECTVCHDREGSYSGDKDTPKRKAFFDNYKDTDKPWTAFAKQPDLVYFSHKVVMTARYEDGRKKSRCGSCHGDKLNSMTTKRIKGTMLMGQCMDCHTALKISNKCMVCHD